MYKEWFVRAKGNWKWAVVQVKWKWGIGYMFIKCLAEVLVQRKHWFKLLTIKTPYLYVLYFALNHVSHYVNYRKTFKVFYYSVSLYFSNSIYTIKKKVLYSKTLPLGHKSLSFQTSNLQFLPKSTLILSSWCSSRRRYFSAQGWSLPPLQVPAPLAFLNPFILWSLLSLVSWTPYFPTPSHGTEMPSASNI